MKKLDTPVERWQIFLTANNSKIYSDPVNQIDFTVTSPIILIDFDQTIKRIDYLKPKINFIMFHNSSGFAKEHDFTY